MTEAKETSSARLFIENLLSSGEAHVVPKNLQDQKVGSKFNTEKDEMVGYHAQIENLVNLDQEETSRKGEYEITYKGSFPRIIFEGKVGTTDRSFLVITSQSGGGRKIAFIVE